MDTLTLHPAFLQRDISSLREIVASEIKARADHPYHWCLPATETTDQFIEEFLRNWQGTIAFNPGLLLGNLRAASDLLDKAVGRRSEITSLEERCITTFLDYQLADSVQPINLKLAKLYLKATRKEGAAGPGDADESTLDAQNQAESSARRLRLLLHRSPGNPLNFGERITNLRLLLGDSMVAIYERLNAVRIGLSHFGIFQADRVPTWDGTSSRNMQNLVEWLRDVIRRYEAASNSRVEYIRNIYLGADNVVIGGATAVQTELAIDRDHDLDFVIDIGKVSSVYEHSIISDVSVSLAFKENSVDFGAGLATPDSRSSFSLIDSWHRSGRESWVMSALIKAPNQVTLLGGGETKQWSRPTMPLTDIPARWTGAYRQTLLDPLAMSGLNPIGAWSLNIEKNLRSTAGDSIPIAALKLGINNTLWQVSDVVLSLRLQNWK
jgi:hypothetical protein